MELMTFNREEDADGDAKAASDVDEWQWVTLCWNATLIVHSIPSLVQKRLDFFMCVVSFIGLRIIIGSTRSNTKRVRTTTGYRDCNKFMWYRSESTPELGGVITCESIRDIIVIKGC